MNLTRTNWPLGWTSDADQVNGDPAGLLRMDNLQIEETGTISLTRGIQELNGSLPDWVYRMYSRIVNGTEFVWAALNVSGTSVIRTNDLFSSFQTVINAGGQRACFGEAFGNVLISCGLQRVKDSGTGIPTQLGIVTPTTAPVINQINQQGIDLSDGFSCTGLEGTMFSSVGNGGLIFVDPITLRGVIETSYGDSGIDTVHFGVPGLNSNSDPGQDLFTMLFQPGDTSQFTKFRVEWDLDGSYGNTYYYEWNPATDLMQGIDVQTVVAIPRSAFTRTGSDGTKDWTKIFHFRVTGLATAVNKFLASEQNFTGGAQGSLNADYEYVCFMVANNSTNGPYIGTSGPSPISTLASIYNGYASVKLPSSSDPQVNQCWLYRRSKATSRNATVALNTFYLVAQSAPGATVQDTLSDDDALIQNIVANLNLISLQDVRDDVFSMEGLFNTRMVYATINNVLLSDSLNPDAIDASITLKVSGDAAEQNLFVKSLTNNTMILATTKDLYYISGTLTLAPDGTLDITVQVIGEAYPPLSSDFCFNEGLLYYIAADGLRYTTGSNSVRVVGLDLLFQGMTRYDVPPVALIAENQEEYSLTFGRGGKIWMALPFMDGTRRLIVYNIQTRQFRLQYTDPISVHATQTGVVIAGYNLSTNTNLAGGVFQLDVGFGIQDSGGNLIEGVPITLQTVCDSNQQPRNRKDTFTLKIIADTGGRDCDIAVCVDVVSGNEATYTSIGTINTNGMETSYFDMSGSPTLGFRYGFKIVDKNLVTFFKLYELTLEYESRPEQLNFIRIPNSNLSTISRKRFTNYALTVDTLGNDILVTPFVDNIAGIPDTINTQGKTTYIYYFTSDTIGIDISATLSGGIFEFYQLNTDEIVSEKLPPAVKFLVIPANNYGTPSRKRHTSYKFQINTRGNDVVFTPILDSTTYPSQVFNTPTKETVEYFFNPTVDVCAVDIGGTLSSATPFEFYGTITPQEVETLPALLRSYYLPKSNLGTPARKRMKSIPIIIDTHGFDVNLFVTVDSMIFGPQVVNTSFKHTTYFYFTADAVGVDFGAYIEALTINPFECYGLDMQNAVAETLPVPAEYLLIPPNNYGNPGRKRFTSYKFVIDTGGLDLDVTFTPIVDNVVFSGNPLVFSTARGKQTVNYYFPVDMDVTGVDIGGTLTAITPFEFYGPVTPEKVEVLPPLLESLYLPIDNLGSVGRKRLKTITFNINTFGKEVHFNLFVDSVASNSQIVRTEAKQTVYYFFTEDMLGIDFAMQLLSAIPSPFEFYGIDLNGCIHEELPVQTEYLIIPPNNYGTPNRKRFTSIKFTINTLGNPVIFTPFIDGSNFAPGVINTSTKQTVEFFFDPTLDLKGIDIGGSLVGGPFEFYEIVTPQEVEQLPALLESYYLPVSNLGSPARKRLKSIPIVIDTHGSDVHFVISIDGVLKPALVINTNFKQTIYYYFTFDSVGVDFGCSLIGTAAFECYGLNLQDAITETLPVRTEYLFIPPDDYGNPGRKRFTSYKFQIDTLGNPVTFQSIVDNISLGVPFTFTTTAGKQLMEYFFPVEDDITGINIGGIITGGPFEFYGPIIPEQIEKLPPRLKSYYMPVTNFGTVARKRLKTLAFSIYTAGSDVAFNLIVDGVAHPTQIVSTTYKQTVYYYPQEDVLGIDYAIFFEGSIPFEFYGLELTECVYETKPVATEYFNIVPTNNGHPGRKRFTSFKFVINCMGNVVLFTPIVDGTSYRQFVFSNNEKATVEYFFDQALDVKGIDIGGILQSQASGPFEFYEVLTPEDIEQLPPRLESYYLPVSNLGTAARKRLKTIPIIIDTAGTDVIFTITIDGQQKTPLRINTAFKQTAYYYFTYDSVGVDFGCSLIGSVPFECYGLSLQDAIAETLPMRTEYYLIEPNDYGSPGRKRFTSYKFQIDTLGNDVTFQNVVEGSFIGSSLVINCTGKTLIEYFFNPTLNVTGKNIGGLLTGGPFEFYGPIVPEMVEKLPPRLMSYYMPVSNLGSVSRKRLLTLAFSIHTGGSNVSFNLIVDGVFQPAQVVNTIYKKTVYYYFESDVLGTDFAIYFQGTAPFEFYGLELGDCVYENKPVATEFYVIAPNNYGTPNRKRFTSYKFQINTRGTEVVFTPIVDSTEHTSLTFSTLDKQTIEYFFDTNLDITGIDIGGTLSGGPFEFYKEIVPQEVEQLPARLESYYLPVSNLGSAARKRLKTIPIVINTQSQDVTFNIFIDGQQKTPLVINTSFKQTVYYYFDFDSVGVDFGCNLQSNTRSPFECYGLSLEECIAETLPMRTEYIHIPVSNWGSPGRKRFTSFKFEIDTLDTEVTYAPLVDGLPIGPPLTFTTLAKKTIEYFFPANLNVTGIDIGGTITGGPFEFYGPIAPEQVEKLPPRLESYYMPVTNFGSVSRKRLKTIAFSIHTSGFPVTFNLIVDGMRQPDQIVDTQYKKTVYYYFQTDVIGTDFAIFFQGVAPFEFYGLEMDQCVYENKPVATEYYVISPNNYGTPGRKRHTSYKFQINTRGNPCIFTPLVDGITYREFPFSTLDKTTVEYFFDTNLDVTGIDIGGILTGGPFEFYEVVVPEKVEQLPPRLESLYLPYENFGTVARKRIRTIPLIIYTGGSDVSYTPNIDGIDYPSTVFNTTYKQTVYYFFVSDMFGIDVGGKLIGTSPFEFYGFGTPENVETLPVPKIYDQFQPMRFDRIGKLFNLRIRLISTGDTSIPFAIYANDSPTLSQNSQPLYTSSFAVTPNVDNTYEVDLPKNVNGTVLRLTLGPTLKPFHRYDIQVKVSTSGMESDSQWKNLR